MTNILKYYTNTDQKDQQCKYYLFEDNQIEKIG